MMSVQPLDSSEGKNICQFAPRTVSHTRRGQAQLVPGTDWYIPAIQARSGADIPRAQPVGNPE